MVRAKFRYSGIETIDQGNGVRLCTLTFYPVSDGKEDSDNHKFWKATPSGKLELGMVNDYAVKQFVLGKEYYLDISEA